MGRMTWRRQLLSQVMLVLAGLFVVLPVVWMIRIAFDGSIKLRPRDASLLPHTWTLARLSEVWRAPRAGSSFVDLLNNSLIVAGGTAVIAVVFGATAAYAFARFHFAGRNLGLLGALALVTVPPAGLIAPYFLFLNALGIRDSLWSLVIVYSAIAVPFATWIIRNAIQGVPLELEEAALLEGASRWRVFTRIILPLVAPSLAVAGFTGFTLAWSEFALGWAFISDPRRVTLAMALYGMRSETSVSWGLMCALALLVAAPVLVLFYALGKYVIVGLSLGTASSET